MNKIAKRITAAVMAAAMLLPLTGCGKKGSEMASKEHVFSAEKISLPEKLDNLSAIRCAGDKLFILGDRYWNEGEGEEMQYFNQTKLQIISLDGTLENEMIISDSSRDGGNGGKNIRNMELDADGGIIALQEVYNFDETTYESDTEYTVVKYDSEGKAAKEISLKSVKDEYEKVSENENSFWINSFIPTDDGKIIIPIDNKLFIVDDSGKLLNTISYGDGKDHVYISNLYKTGDGRIVTNIDVNKQVGDKWENESKIVVIDIANNKFGDEFQFSGGYGTFMNGTEKYDLLISRESGLYGYDIESGSSEIIIDWLKSGFDTTAMMTETTTVLQDGRILCASRDYQYSGGGGYGWGSNDEIFISVLTEVDPATIPDKKLIKLYALWLDIGVKRQILEFNKTSQEYEIELTSYGDDINYDEAVSKMNNDMISGNLPDILLVNNSLPVDSYISKGLFANLYDFMETDPDVNKEDFLTNLFEAFEVNGALYYTVPDFTISTMVGKSSLVGEEQGWTMDEFMALAEANPEMNIFEGRDFTNTNMLSMFFSYNYDTFIDRHTGECSLNSDAFIKMMEFCNRFPSEIKDDNEYDESYWQEYNSQWRNGKTILSSEYIGRFQVIRELEQGKFGEKITFKGMPGSNGNGSIFSGSNTLLAITAKSANKEGAWQFVKYFFSDEYQDMFADRDSYNFPAKLSALEKKAETAKERPYWEKETGEKEYYDNTYWNGVESVDIGVNTDEDNARMMEFIKSITATGNYDTNIQNIITEESAPFFSGQKTAQQAAEIIQNRVANYIAENR